MTLLYLALLFMVVAAVVSVVAAQLRLPYTVALVIAGAAAGSLHLFPPVHVGPEAIVTLLILPLLFEGSLKLDPGDLRAYGGLIGTLAVPGTLVAALAITGAGTLWRLPGPTAFLLGAVAAATDPVSVIALIQEVRLDRRLGALLEGEAVLNDGVAIVLFTLVVSPAGGGLLGAAGRFVWLLAAGGAIGFLAGRAVSYALGRVRQPLIEALGSLILAVGAFIAAEALGASGVIAVALAGITFGGRGLQHLTEDARQTLRTLWDVIAFLANSALFLLIGLEVPVGLLARHAGLIGTVILAALAVRAATVYSLTARPLRGTAPIPAAWRPVLVWGGLRGGVALALVLDLPADLPGREPVAAAIFGLVVFTLLGQALTMKPLMRAVGLLSHT